MVSLRTQFYVRFSTLPGTAWSCVFMPALCPGCALGQAPRLRTRPQTGVASATAQWRARPSPPRADSSDVGAAFRDGPGYIHRVAAESPNRLYSKPAKIATCSGRGNGNTTYVACSNVASPTPEECPLGKFCAA
jgi:hypothetical protein